jgi:poly-gamma-glutamate synthesis protein (capsule biosynthesis protein)
MDVGSKFSFRMDPEVVKGLKLAGFDALSVANNHSGDWGRAAFDDTISILNAAGIIPVGDGSEAKIYEAGGLKIALFAFSDFPGPGERAEDEAIKNGISNARNAADFIVVSFHFGEEYQEEPSQRQRRIAELAADSGADLVIGHHPHVSQPLEEYGDSYIAYSLGNFVFDQYFSEETMKGSLLEVGIKDGAIAGARLREVRLNENYQPHFID